MKIETFSQRQKAGELYDNIFNIDKEYALDFSLFNDLQCYGAISEDEFNEFTERFEKIGQNLWNEINIFDKNQLNKVK